MASYSVRFCLRWLLLKKIYASDISLIRNDSETARQVFDYIQSVDAIVEAEKDGILMSFDEAIEARLTIEPLVGLRPQTIRKYIADLWNDGSYLTTFVRVEADHTVTNYSRFL